MINTELTFTKGKITRELSGELKTCCKCGNIFPATTEYFYKHNTSKDGLRGDCKACKNNYNKSSNNYKASSKKYYEKNKDKILAQQKQYSEQYKEKIAVSHHEYYSKNKERLNKLNAENRNKNKDRYNEYSRKWAKNNLEKVRLSNQKRKAKIKKLPATLTTEEWEEIKRKFNNRCAYCGQEQTLEQDHFIPLTNNGEYTHNNIIPACKSCNSSKSNRNFFEWYSQQEFYNKSREKKILKFLNYTEGGKQQLSFVMRI